jgi:prepilin-type N-terminal cleavage/methylation domain-containing protein
MKLVTAKHPGFTLIEMAIVLVVIGLILGMVYKGRALVDSAKVKKMAAQYNKIIGAMNVYYDRYGSYPGDGCGPPVNNRTPASPMDCTGQKDGILDDENGGTNNGYETEAAWHLLIDVTGILTEADRESVFGQPWDLIGGVDRIAGISGSTGTWMDLPGGAQADPRLACSLDRMLDDGVSNTGSIITPGASYTQDTDCWSLSGQVNVHLKVLP